MLPAALLFMTSGRGRGGRQPHLALLGELDSQQHQIGHQCYHGSRRYYYLTNNANRDLKPRDPICPRRHTDMLGPGRSADPLAEGHAGRLSPRDPGWPGAGATGAGQPDRGTGGGWDWRHWLARGWREKLDPYAHTGRGSM